MMTAMRVAARTAAGTRSMMTVKRGVNAWVWIAAVALLLPAAGRADLTVKEETRTSGMMGMLASKGTETTYIKGDKMRTEGTTEMGGMMAGMMQGAGTPDVSEVLSITRLDKGVMWIVNDGDSTYAEMSLEGAAGDSAAASNIKVKDISVRKTGESKTILSHKCEGTEVAIVFEMAMGEGEEREVRTYNVTALFWMRPEVEGMEEFRRFWDRMVDAVGVAQEGGPMAEAMRPVLGELKDIKGVPLGMEMTMANPMGAGAMGDEERAEMQAAMQMMREMMKGQGQAAGEGEEGAGDDQIRITRYVTSITEGTLNDSLFEVPKGYTKIESLQRMFAPGMGE